MGRADETDNTDGHPAPADHPKAPHRWVKGQSRAVTAGSLDRRNIAMQRNISAKLRELHTPEEMGHALWSMFAGVDPFAAPRAPHPDGVPHTMGSEGPGPIDWSVRLAAGKLYAEYAYGKPLQGVVVDSMIQSETTINVNATGPIDPRSLPPELRAMLRQLASAAVGKPVARGPIAVPVLVAPEPAPAVQLPADRVGSECDVPAAGQSVNLDDAGRCDVDGLPMGDRTRGADVGGLGEVELVGAGHDSTVQSAEPSVKPITIDFPGSMNLHSATLEGGILTVRFLRDGEVGPRYQYRNVTPDMMARWRAAPSAGAWFAREIRARHQQFPLLDGKVGRWPGATL